MTNQNYGYDAYGNLTSRVSVDAATNRLTGSGISYDVAGNQLSNGTYGSDSLNMMTIDTPPPGEDLAGWIHQSDWLYSDAFGTEIIASRPPE